MERQRARAAHQFLAARRRAFLSEIVGLLSGQPNELLSWEEELTSELETIRSAKIYLRAQEMLAEMGVLEVNGTRYQINPRKVDANTPGKSSIVHILYQDREPETVEQVVRALTQSYKEFRSEGRAPDPDAFDAARADFSGMTKEDRLFIGNVLHKAFVAVDEAGTEAAAATVVTMRKGGRPGKPVEFHADRPFLFLIRHAKTGCVLFLGRVVDPGA